MAFFDFSGFNRAARTKTCAEVFASPHEDYCRVKRAVDAARGG